MKITRSKTTVEDDVWAFNRMKQPGITEAGTYRYMDPNGVVHRAKWEGPSNPRWRSCCDEKVVEKLQDHDVGAVTCVRCIGSGA